MIRHLLVLAASGLVLAPPSSSQSGIDEQARSTSYLNLETPQVKPIAIATIDDIEFVLACNTADSSVEILAAADLETLHRVPVGQEPASVVWVPSEGAFYTCNTLGDSVTKVSLQIAPGGAVATTVLGSQHVGDEPMHLAWLEGSSPPTLAVSLETTGEVALLNASTLDPIATLELVDPDETHVLKHPRTVVSSSSGGLFVLGGHGASVDVLVGGGFDLYFAADPNVGASAEWDHLGTTLFNMVRAGDELFIVSGSRPGGLQGVGEPGVAAADFGFVESWVHRLNVAPGSAPDSRNLNVDNGGAPVDTTESLCQPMDVVALTGAKGAVDKLFIASFGTDRIATVTDLDLAPASWTIDAFDVVPLKGGSIAGPRGLALSGGGDALFVMNRVDSSVMKYDTATHALLASQELVFDPTPEYVRLGRRFLYDAKLSSTGFVSCASCHVDGRLDGLLWNLGVNGTDQDGQSELFSRLLDGITPESVADYVMAGFYLQKGLMMTQSLQGLVNWETDPGCQSLFSNAPYHWRGDRADFVDFGGAFRTLLLGPTDPGDPNHVSEADMVAFQRFVNSIAYPPNPEQELERVYGGSFGVPYGPGSGDGPMLGIQAYHTTAFPGGRSAGRSCVQCHSLPEGSNNRLTQVFGAPTTGAIDNFMPTESSAWRGLRQKEKLHVRLSDTGHEVTDLISQVDGGLAHFNAFATIDAFVGSFDLGDAVDEMAEFLRRLDTGTAPVVGRTFSVSLGGMSAEQSDLYDLFLEQANVGNAGLVVHLQRFGGACEGYWYDQGDTNAAAPFRREPDGLRQSWDDLIGQLGILPGEVLQITIACSPLGSERRLAHPTGDPAPLTGPDPVVNALLPMEPNTAYRLVPQLRDNWDPQPEPGPGNFKPTRFRWDANPQPGFSDSEPESLRITRVMQNALVDAGLLPWTRHDAPRRFLVRGSDIRHGAVLEIEIGPNRDPVLRFPIFATGKKGVWTTAAEAEPTLYYSLMLGGPTLPAVDRLLNGDIPGEEAPPNVFDVAGDNLHIVRVINADDSFGELVAVPITLSDTP